MFDLGTRKLYLSPNDDVVTPLLAMVENAQRSILVAAYAFTLAPLVSALIDRHNAGVSVRLVLDSSQAGSSADVSHQRIAQALALDELAAGGSAERAQILRLEAADIVQGTGYVEGQSSKGSILHEKAVMVDHAITFYGSWNFSVSASLQSNHAFIENDGPVCAAFEAAWLADWTRLHGATLERERWTPV